MMNLVLYYYEAQYIQSDTFERITFDTFEIVMREFNPNDLKTEQSTSPYKRYVVINDEKLPHSIPM